MAETNLYDELAKKTKEEYPRFNTRPRDKSWLRIPFGILRIFTGQSYKTFHTTVFSTLYTGPRWEKMTDKEKYKLLRHEREHIRQFHCWPLGRWAWPLNHILMSLCYMLVLPILWTLRAKFEREGYLQTMLTEYELYGEFDERKMESWARWMAETFGTGVYAWMWTKKKAYAWAMDTMRKINAGEIKHDLGDPAWAIPRPQDEGAA